MAEEWRDVVGYEGLYQVSNLGRVKSLARVVNNPTGTGRLKGESILSAKPRRRDGYIYVSLNSGGFVYKAKVHRLVAEAFVENPKGRRYVHHKDANPGNNCVENLEWVSHYENMKYHWEQKAKKGFCVTGLECKPYKAIFTTFGVSVNLGYFDDAKSAREAYRCAYLNWYGKEPKLLHIED
jgi:hypothetical protein